MPNTQLLDSLRKEIQDIDDQIVTLIGERFKVVQKIAETKASLNVPIINQETEQKVVDNYRKRAKEISLEEKCAEEVAQTLIRFSCFRQEALIKSQHKAKGKKQNILIIGGLGRMGRWFSSYFEAAGHRVEKCDTSGQTATQPGLSSLMPGGFDGYDTIILSTPISKTPGIIEELTKAGTRALVFDLCSVKSPLIPSIQKALKQGISITSIHPMFGPNIKSLLGQIIILCETGEKPELSDRAATLFSESPANLVRIPLSEHDRFAAYVQGLTHLSNFIYATALARGQIPVSDLKPLGSTSFHAQLAVTEPLLAESQEMYFYIQDQNRFVGEMLKNYQSVIDSFVKAIVNHDKETFLTLMKEGAEYLKLPTEGKPV